MDSISIKRIRDLICNSLSVNDEIIRDISPIKKGMTNRSYAFWMDKEKYIIRVPGEGTEKLLSRKEEAAVYDAINNMGICDDVVFFDVRSGVKISKFLNDARVCDPHNSNDVSKCVRKMRDFHEMRFQVTHRFDIFEKIDYYESLWGKDDSIYESYHSVKSSVFLFRPYIFDHVENIALTHIDAVPDNFLIKGDEVRLIDWEYASMQDPHVDLAMFAIYSAYSRKEIDSLIDLYFENQGGCPWDIRIKIYCYVAACGLLWSNWCEYKNTLGVQFGEYATTQFQYAAEYSKLVMNELSQRGYVFDGSDK